MAKKAARNRTSNGNGARLGFERKLWLVAENGVELYSPATLRELASWLDLGSSLAWPGMERLHYFIGTAGKSSRITMNRKRIISMFRAVWHVTLFFLILGCGACVWGQTKVDSAAQQKGLVGWWKLDDTEGQIATDSSAYHRHGRLAGEQSFDTRAVAGRIGKAVQFGDQQGEIKISEYKGVTGPAPRTVTAWIKTSYAQGSIVLWGSDDAGKIFRLGFIRGRIGLDPSGGYLYINDDLTDDHWHHVAVVVQEGDPPNLHDNVTLFVDGAIADIHDIGLLDLWPLDTGDQTEVTIGQGFRGLIDEVRIYDRALSVDEIKTLFAAE